MKRCGIFLAKLLVSAVLLTALVASVDRQQIVTRIRHVDMSIFVAAVIGLALFSLPHMLRWQMILRHLGSNISAGDTLTMIYVGYFFNQILPSSIGGDAARLWYVYRAGTPVRAALASLLADRVAAVFGVLIVGVLFAPFYGRLLGSVAGYVVGGASLILITVAFASLLLGAKVLSALPFSSLKALAGALESARTVLTARDTGVPVLIWSLVIQIGIGTASYLVALSAGIPISLYESLLLFPLINLASTLPVSIAGWGVREAAAIFVLRPAGLTANDALVISLLFGAAMMIISLPGAFLWLIQRKSSDYKRQQDST